MKAVNYKQALAIIAKCTATLPFKSRDQHQTSVHLHSDAYRRRDFSRNPDQEPQTSSRRPMWMQAEIMYSRPLTSPPLWYHVLSSYKPVQLCLLMSAVKEMVPEHSSGGRVMWAGERYRWFDCCPPGKWANNSKCTKPLCRNVHTQTAFPPIISVCQPKVIVVELFLQSHVFVYMYYQR